MIPTTPMRPKPLRLAELVATLGAGVLGLVVACMVRGGTAARCGVVVMFALAGLGVATLVYDWKEEKRTR